MRMKTNIEFINDAKKVHHNKYDYSKSVYMGAAKNINIICYLHGKFPQNAHLHLRGKGCPKCQKNEKIYTTQEFIRRAKRVHGDTYNYQKVDFKHSRIPVEIICNRHGSFFQMPNKHLQQHGCSKCNFSKGEQRISKWLECNEIEYDTQKTFIKCINPHTNRKLKFDFYLPSQNILIEFDGRQHFESVSTNTFKREALKDIQDRDKIKNDYAISNNIKLIRIPYHKFHEIENIMAEQLKKVDIIIDI